MSDVGVLECLASVHFKRGDFKECRKVLSQAMLINEDFASRFCCLPVDAEFSWEDYPDAALRLIFPRIVGKTQYTDAFTKYTSNLLVLEWKQRHFMKRYKEAPLERLLQESEQHQWDEFKRVRLFLLGRLPVDFESDSFPLCVHLDPIALSGDRIKDIRELERQIEDRTRQLKSLKERDVLTDSYLAFTIIRRLRCLSRLYRLMGVYKATQRNAKQAFDLAKSLWPSNICNDLQKELDEIETATKTVQPTCSLERPFVYTQRALSELASLWVNYQNGSPSEFSRAVFKGLRDRAIPLERAPALLALTSWLPFHRQAQLNEDCPDLESFDEWRPKLEDNTLGLFYDADSCSLVMMMGSRILFLPISNFNEVTERLRPSCLRTRRFCSGARERTLAIPSSSEDGGRPDRRWTWPLPRSCPSSTPNGFGPSR